MEDYVLYKELSNNLIQTYYSPSTGKYKIVSPSLNRTVHTFDEAKVESIINNIHNQIETEQALKAITRIIKYK
jgi:hypothetical protein